MERKVSTLHLKPGMYISNIDRPWGDTPFLIQGFFIKTEEEMSALTQYCEYVMIDIDKGVEADCYLGEVPKLKTNDYLEKFLKKDRPLKVEYENKKTTEEETPQAKIALEDATSQVASIMEDVNKGKSLNVEAVRGVVEPILESIIRNSDAVMWLTQLRKKDVYSYSHSVDNCALAVAFGRHLGLPKRDLRTLALGLLLMDVGKMRVPDEILNKTATLNDAEFKIVKRHVDYSVDILRNTEGISQDIINIALTHHERFDGSGYPSGLIGTATPVYGRIAAIIDCYDAMTSKRPYCDPISGHRALQDIYNWRNKYFQDELVEQFLQCLGVYPTGSLIEMNTGEVGIVLAQNRTRRLQPKIMLLLDQEKEHYQEYKTVDLTCELEGDDGSSMQILRGLDPGSYGIDPTEFYL